MYQPNVFKGDEATAEALIAEHPFATLVTHDAGVDANHLPLLLERGDDGKRVLVGHMARANPQ